MKILLIIFLLQSFFINAQRPGITWEKSFGGSDDDDARSICETREGLSLILGSSSSADGDITGHISGAGGRDFWLCELDSFGNLIQEKSFGGTYSDEPGQIISSNSGGYVMCGRTGSNNVQVSGNHSLSSDIWLVKLDDSLNIEWQKCLGSTLLEHGYDISEATDSGYLFAGSTTGNDSDVSGNHGDYDIWAGKVTSLGILQWQICLGSPDIEYQGFILATSDGGVLVTGATATGGIGYCSGIPSGYNLWIVKLDSLGTIQWEKCLGSSGWDEGYKIIKDNQNGFFVAAAAGGGGGDVSGYHGGGDIWLLHLDSIGNIIWDNCFGGPDNYECPSSLVVTENNEIVVCGWTRSLTGQATGNHGNRDAFIVKVDSLGNYLWSGCYGGSNRDEARSVVSLADGSIIFSGVTESSDGDVSFNHGGEDFWVVKLEASVSVQEPIDINLFSCKISESKLELFFNSGKSGRVEINLLDLTGRQLLTSNQNYSSGKNEIEIPVNVVGGVYIVQLITTQGAKSFKVFCN